MTFFEIFLDGWRSSQKIYRTRKCLCSRTFLRTQIRNDPRNWYQHQGCTIFLLTSEKTEIAKCACEPKLQRLPAEEALAKQVLRTEKFGDLVTADYKVLNEESESQTVIDTLPWYRILPLYGFSLIRVKQQQETEKSSEKFLEPSQKPSVVYTDNSFQFGKSCEELSWIHRSSFLHRSETNEITERAVRRVKEGTSAVLLQSGLDETWWADSVECCCYLRNVQDLVVEGKSPHERRFGEPFPGPIILFGAMVEYHPMSTKDQPTLHQFGKNCLEYFLDIH